MTELDLSNRSINTGLPAYFKICAVSVFIAKKSDLFKLKPDSYKYLNLSKN